MCYLKHKATEIPKQQQLWNPLYLAQTAMYLCLSCALFLSEVFSQKTFPFCLFWQDTFKGRRAKRHLVQLSCALAELMP